MYYFHECHATLKIILIKKSRDCLEKTKKITVYIFTIFI